MARLSFPVTGVPVGVLDSMNRDPDYMKICFKGGRYRGRAGNPKEPGAYVFFPVAGIDGVAFQYFLDHAGDFMHAGNDTLEDGRRHVVVYLKEAGGKDVIGHCDVLSLAPVETANGDYPYRSSLAARLHVEGESVRTETFRT